MRVMSSSLIVAVAVLAHAQDRISTDRPDFTGASTTVGVGKWQIETGLSYIVAPGVFGFRAPEALLRFGAGTGWEARIGLPNWSRVSVPGAAETGLSDATLGAKFALASCGAWTQAVIVETTVPTATSDFGSDRWEPAVRYTVSRPIDDRWSVGSMLSASTRRDSHATVVDGAFTLVFGRALRSDLSTFVEYAGSFPNRVLKMDDL